MSKRTWIIGACFLLGIAAFNLHHRDQVALKDNQATITSLHTQITNQTHTNDELQKTLNSTNSRLDELSQTVKDGFQSLH